MLKIGIMGAAKIVPRFVAGVKESGQAEVIEIAARNKEKAEKVENVIFGGRLGMYKYFDMHQVIGSAFKKFQSNKI